MEDVAQTCQDTAVMVGGKVVFTGPVSDIIDRASGTTWEVVTSGPPPASGVVVSAVSRTDGTHYRMVSPTRPDEHAIPVSPSLEEGYVALMRSSGDMRS